MNEQKAEFKKGLTLRAIAISAIIAILYTVPLI